MVTLTGVGGVGKTRLALEVAVSVVPNYRDGAWLCELDGVRDADAVPDALTGIFGLDPSPGVTSTDLILKFLRGKQLLLIVDNCEHVLRPVSRLVDAIVTRVPRFGSSRRVGRVSVSWVSGSLSSAPCRFPKRLRTSGTLAAAMPSACSSTAPRRRAPGSLWIRRTPVPSCRSANGSTASRWR